ncbi:MAG: amino acid permease, partial [Planctomycetota bacterium]|jgi:mannitol/fructose-specific phosphotransferase system IIA component (Ntr-type)
MPISTAAGKFAGSAGFVLLSIAAVAAFVTTANGGILAASRSPMAMSRDQLLPPVLARVNKRFKTPHISILLTGGFMIAAIVFLDIEALVKTASTLMIILFILVNASVIIMRESRIQSYKPRFKSPLYPYIHVFAIVAYGALIVDMGRTDRELQTVTLENELRDILLERDDVIEDRFDKLIRDCRILDIEGRTSAEKIFRNISTILAERLESDEYVLFEKFLHRETEGGTVVQPGFAIPHVVVGGEKKFDILLVRARAGIEFKGAAEPVRIMFVLLGSKDERNYHLRALMAIAQIAQEKDFERRWLAARDTEAIRNLILLSARQRDTNP